MGHARRIGKQAVVVGAGIGGMAAARALADHFEHVNSASAAWSPS